MAAPMYLHASTSMKFSLKFTYRIYMKRKEKQFFSSELKEKKITIPMKMENSTYTLQYWWMSSW